jgi:hypothetical protein
MASVTVHCLAPSGLVLRLFEMEEGVLGIKTARRTGEAVTLKNGINPGVDAEFMAAWMKQNENGPLVLNGTVHVEEQK